MKRKAVSLVSVATLASLALLFQFYLLQKAMFGSTISSDPKFQNATVTDIARQSLSSFSKNSSITLKTPEGAVPQSSTAPSGILSDNMSQKTDSKKLILMYNFPEFYELQSGDVMFETCWYPCALSTDPVNASEADCVVFYTHYLYLKQPPLSYRRKGAVWVYFAVESPLYSNNGALGEPAWHKTFNWTMTYRRDSDLHFGYGEFVKEPSDTQAKDLKDLNALVKGKSKMAAWFVSNCHTQSQRERYVAALRTYIEIDIYGGCGDLNCSRDTEETCMDMLSHDYFFYLAFENSFCQDYVTDKVYNIMQKAHVVPIVRGQADYESILPEDSFVDVSDFPSVEALAEYLKQLAGDPIVYMSFLEWKLQWVTKTPMLLPLCELCARLHSKDKWVKVYDDVNSWWHNGTCFKPPPLIL